MRIVEHVLSGQGKSIPKQKERIGHMHTLGWISDSTLSVDKKPAEKMFFDGQGLILLFDGHSGHFHIDCSEEWEDLIASVTGGDYDVK